MGKTNLGRVTFVPRGAYNNETSYKRLDVVEYEGSSYLFLKDSTGITPTGDSEVTMLLAKKGKDFTYDDFTPEQLAALKGADGKDGLKGDKGDPGKGLTILGYYSTLDLLKAAVTTPEPGDAYGIGIAAPYDIYVFDGVTNDWVNNGKLSEGGESGGNVVLIPFAITGLTAESTSEEILTAWGGKENLISICKQMHDSKAICKLYGGDENSSGAYIISVNSTNYINDDNAMMELYVGAGSSSLMLQVLLTNGVASFNVKSQNPVTSTKLPDAIFDLTSQSTSEQILNVFGGIDKIEDIYNKIGSSGENQCDILIADNRYNGNGYSVLHNFGGSWLSASQNNGFDHQIYFAYTSIEPAIEVTRWVIKFNDTSAVCEVTKKEVGGANIVSIPSDVMSLSNESTSEQIINAFGGKPAFDAIIEKVKIGNAVVAVASTSSDSAGSMPCIVMVNNYIDYSNLDMVLEIASEESSLILDITVANSVFNVRRTLLSALQSYNLVSDPSVGGTDKPASAEAVKKVNDKTYISQRFSTTMGDTKYAILLCKLIDTVDEHIVINGWISGIELESRSAIMQAIKIDFSVLNSMLYGTEAYRTAVGIGYYQSMNKPSLCTCVYKEHTWLALDVFNWAGENLSVFNGISNVKLTLESVAYASYDGEFFTTVDHEIENSITILNKNFTKLNAT